MDPRRLKLLLVLPAVGALLLGLLLGALLKSPSPPPAPDPRTVADATLLSIREQGRLTMFTARFVAVVTASG